MSLMTSSRRLLRIRATKSSPLRRPSSSGFSDPDFSLCRAGHSRLFHFREGQQGGKEPEPGKITHSVTFSLFSLKPTDPLPITFSAGRKQTHKQKQFKDVRKDRDPGSEICLSMSRTSKKIGSFTHCDNTHFKI